MFTTIGLLFTGELLDHVSVCPSSYPKVHPADFCQRWRAMLQVDQLIMIIPVVLNLKGNLEMNLSARLGTAANVGELDDPHTRRSIIIGNLALLQVQAAVVSFIAAGVSLVLGLILPRIQRAPTPPPPAANSTLITEAILPRLFALDPRRPLPRPPQTGLRKSGLPTCVCVSFIC